MDDKLPQPPEPPKEGDQVRMHLRLAQEGIARLMGQRARKTWAPAALAGGIAALIAVLGVWLYIYWGLPSVPDAQSLWSLNRQPGITFLDRDGRTLGVRGPYYGSRVAMADLPSYVPLSFIAIEDRRFLEHEGVDRAAIVRAFFANLAAGHTVQGASTITQQLARNLFLTPAQTVRRKMQEMVLASRIEDLMSKDEILELYMNRIYFGDRAYGIDAASRRFFGKPATELTLAEAAMIAGLPKAPSRSAPTENMERAKERQRLVLDAMVEAGYITADQREAAADARIRLARNNGEGPLGYVFDMAFAQACDRIGRARNAPDIDDMTAFCPPETRGGRRSPAAVGDMVIRLTIDPRLQNTAVDAVRRRLGAHGRNRQKPLQAAFVAMDREGAVRALVGGADYSASKFNRVTQARRQPGSSFKAFVYAAALAEGLDTEDVRFDEPVVIDGWRPRNYDDGYQGAVTLRTAFALSINTVAAQVASEVGPRKVADLAASFGIATMPPGEQWVPPSIALGTLESTLWDMTSAFSVFMHEGERIEPHLIDDISSSSGELLYQYEPAAPTRVWDADLAHNMTSMLGAVVMRGTGTRAQLEGRDVAGKTGTSQDWRDAWFIGYTADYIGGAWVGYDDYTSLNRRGGPGRVTGGAYPTEIWNIVMTEAHRNVEPHQLAGIEQPLRSERELGLATFYNLLKDAFGNDDFPVDAEAPPEDYFQ